MRVAFFVQYCHTAGTYFRWHNLAIALLQIGVEIDVYAGDFNSKAKSRIENRDGVNYYITPSLITHRIFPNPSDPFSAYRRIFNLPQKEYDVYHLFQPFFQAFSPWNYLRKKTNAIFIYDWDDLWTGGLFGAPKTLRERYVYSLVRKLESRLPSISDGVTVCSSFLKDKIPSTVASKILYNGFWSINALDKNSVRKKWGLHEGFFYLAYIGKTANELSWIESVLNHLSNDFSSLRLLVVGPPQQTVQDLGLLNHPMVSYLGEVTPLEAAEIATASDLGLIPLENSAFNQSRFPIKFFDFLSAGTPIYFSGVGEIRSIAKNIDAAFEGSFVRDEWVKGLSFTVKQLLQQDVKVNRGDLSLHYAWPAVVQQLLQFYEQIIHGKK